MLVAGPVDMSMGGAPVSRSMSAGEPSYSLRAESARSNLKRRLRLSYTFLQRVCDDDRDENHAFYRARAPGA